MPEGYAPKQEIKIKVAFEAGAAMYPSSWSDSPTFEGLIFPEEARGKITLIYQEDGKKGISYQPVEGEIPGWND